MAAFPSSGYLPMKARKFLPSAGSPARSGTARNALCRLWLVT